MKKLFLTVATLALLSTSSFADQNTDNMNRMDELRKMMHHSKMMMMQEMEMIKKQAAMFTAMERQMRIMEENMTNKK